MRRGGSDRLKGMILLTRRAEFSAAHFYWVEGWTEEQNRAVFGMCANRNGHGHNYVVEVTVAGEPDPVTGFVVDLKELRDVIEREVVGVWDHRHLNLEIEEFRQRQPTVENLAVSAWERLEGKIDGARLHRVRVYEREDLFADFFGEWQ